MSFKDHLQKGLTYLDHKICYIIYQIQDKEKEISKLEGNLSDLYDQLEELENEKISLTKHMKGYENLDKVSEIIFEAPCRHY